MRQLTIAALAVALVACSNGGGDGASDGRPPATPPSPAGGRPVSGPVVATFASAGTRLQVTEVVRGLDTVWSLAWDRDGALWYTERAGRLTKLGERPQQVTGVEEQPLGEGGLMGLEIDSRGRRFVMYTGDRDNRVVRLEADGSQRVLVSGVAKAIFHNGGRLRFGPDGALYASTGDARREELSADPDSLNGKVLRVDPESGDRSVFSRGHRNVQGLCFAREGRLYATEHGPSGNDEVNVLTQGFDGGWPAVSGNGIKNYASSVAPAGCMVYDSELVPRWRGSLLFATLRGASLRRLSLNADGSVSGEEILLAGQLGRLRDVAVGPDGAVYLATSNRDGRGDPRPGDDRILRIAPAA